MSYGTKRPAAILAIVAALSGCGSEANVPSGDTSDAEPTTTSPAPDTAPATENYEVLANPDRPEGLGDHATGTGSLVVREIIEGTVCFAIKQSFENHDPVEYLVIFPADYSARDGQAGIELLAPNGDTVAVENDDVSWVGGNLDTTDPLLGTKCDTEGISGYFKASSARSTS